MVSLINAQSNKSNLKKKMVARGIFQAELKAFLQDKLANQGFADVKVRFTENRKEIIIFATRVQNILGDNRRNYNEIKSLIQQRFGFKNDEFELSVHKIPNRGLCASAQAESVKYKLEEGINARRACLSVVDFVMKNQAKGVEVSVSGKLRGQRAKTVKFKDGHMIKSGDATNYYVEEAVKHVMLKQGVLGVRVKIQLPYDERGVSGPSVMLPDYVHIKEPEIDVEEVAEPVVQQDSVIIPQHRAPERDVDQCGLIQQEHQMQ